MNPGDSGSFIQELDEARKVQMGMLPQSVPEIPGFEIAKHIAPALSVGGDFYDFIGLPGDKLGIVFGDAVGHGIASALLMSMTLANFRFVAPIETKPQTVIEHINHHLCLSKGISQSSSVAAVYMIVDWRDATISCSVAGLQPYLIRQGNCEPIEVNGTRFPLGITSDTTYESVSLSPEIGEAIVLTTDGIPEALNADGRLYGFDRLEKLLAANAKCSASEIIEIVLRDLQKFVGNVPQQDDINIVVLKRVDSSKTGEPRHGQNSILANELMIKSVFQYVLSPRVIDRLIENPSIFQFEGTEREATVLFSDIRAATDLMSILTPQELYRYLNEYNDSMAQIVIDNDGMLDKFVGDELMAIWGAPVYFENHAYKACKAAIEMTEALKALNMKWKIEGLPEMRIGIGINSGQMVFGHLGYRYRVNYTPMGNAVNLGARLEGTNKKYGTTILVGAETYSMAKDSIVARKVDSINVRRASADENPSETIYELVSLGGNAINAN